MNLLNVQYKLAHLRQSLRAEQTRHQLAQAAAVLEDADALLEEMQELAQAVALAAAQTKAQAGEQAPDASTGLAKG